jgi:preprotein translocase subunit SecD
MTNRRQSGSNYFFLYVAIVLISFYTSISNAAELSGDRPWTHSFEIRLASNESVEGWNRVISPENGEAIWISPEAIMTNDDVRLAEVRMIDNNFYVDFEFTEDGAKILANLTKSHIGTIMAMMVDGQIVSSPVIKNRIKGGHAMLSGDFTYERAREIAQGITVQKKSE